VSEAKPADVLTCASRPDEESIAALIDGVCTHVHVGGKAPGAAGGRRRRRAALASAKRGATRMSSPLAAQTTPTNHSKAALKVLTVLRFSV
jgi:hypothetical protein